MPYSLDAFSPATYHAHYASNDNRSAPEIVTLYAANIPATAIRAKIRQRYEKNKYVDDLQAVDILLAKSQMDYQETLNAWKMDSHLMRMFNDEEVRACAFFACVADAQLADPSTDGNLLASAKLPFPCPHILQIPPQPGEFNNAQQNDVSDSAFPPCRSRFPRQVLLFT